MLAGMLLDVIEPTRSIDAAMHLRANSQRLRRKVEDASIFLVGNFGNRDLLAVGGQQTKIVYLAAAGGIKSRPVEHNGCSAIVVERFDHAGVKVIKKRVVVVKAIGHRKQLTIIFGHGWKSCPFKIEFLR
jgi:hypothetical protein